MSIEVFRKKPIEVETMLWDGTNGRLKAIQEWVGWCGDEDFPDLPGFQLRDGTGRGSRLAEVWNNQENDWVACPVGHRVVQGKLGEYYPVSPAAIGETFEPAGDS